MQDTLCLDRADTATLLLSNVSVWKYKVQKYFWPMTSSDHVSQSTKPGSVCGCKLLTVFFSPLNSRFGFNFSYSLFWWCCSCSGWRINRSVVSPHWETLKLFLTGSPGGLMLMLESSVEGSSFVAPYRGRIEWCGSSFPLQLDCTAACFPIATSLYRKDPDCSSYFCGPL